MMNSLIRAAGCVSVRTGRAPVEQAHAASATHASEAPDLSKRRMHGHRKAQSGVGLIEVLVAVLVLSIGFLGVAALQVMSLSTNNSAMARSMATIASYSILDAMRADIGSAGAGAYNTATPIKANACPTTTSTLAETQLKQWCAQLGQTLGQAATTTGTIACTGANPVSCTVTIVFNDSRAGVGGTSNQQIVTQGML